jgi:hypothetical protein
MRAAAIQTHALVCAPPGAAAAALAPWPRRAAGGGGGGPLLHHHRLRSDLPHTRSLPCRARSPSSSSSSNVNSGRGDDADNLLEDLLSKHGEVVYNAGGAPGIDADDDAECLSCMLPLHSSLSNSSLLMPSQSRN